MATTERYESLVHSSPLTLAGLETQEISGDEFWEGTMDEYLAIAQERPAVSYTAHQRMYQSVVSWGSEQYSFAGEPYIHHRFFDDPAEDGREAIFGLDKPLTKLVNVLKASASRFGQERRIILLHGPVGSSKSTIARLLRRGLGDYTKTDAGKLYTYSWYAEPASEEYESLRRMFGIVEAQEGFVRCPLHEDPLKLLPPDVRATIIKRMNGVKVRRTEEEMAHLPESERTLVNARERDRVPEEVIHLEGDLCPLCRFIWRNLLRRYGGDWKQVLSRHVRTERLIFSEADRVGIGSYTPKDEKNQDSTELSGDINWSKIKYFGSESDPRAFDFARGEYFIANRGILYKEEMLKLDKAFLYDDLHVSQDHMVKPKGFSLVDIDEVLIGGTNNPEYEGLRDDEKMEAFRDRTTRVDIPYVVKWSHECEIYKKVYRFAPGGKHMDPHVIRMAALWAILTRLEEPKADEHVDLLQKAKIYDGQFLGTEFGEDIIKKLQDGAGEKEAMKQAISPRYIQDKISNTVVKDPFSTCVTVSMVFPELEEGLQAHSLIKAATKKDELKTRLKLVEAEYEEIMKEEVERAVAADEKGIVDLFNNYITNLRAYKRSGVNAKVKNAITGQDEPYNERLMREVEERAGVDERSKDQFRTTLYERIAELALEGKPFDYRSNEKFYKGLRGKLFNDRKDQIKLSTLNTRVIDPEEQEKIEVIKKRLKTMFGYCDVCATVVLHRVASIFARGEAIPQPK